MTTSGGAAPGSATRDGSSAAIADGLRRYFRETRPPGLISAYLFGSHAAGRAHRESDVDVGVCLDRRVLPERAARFELRVRLTSDLIHAVRCNDVDVVVLNDAPPLLARRVLRHGMNLVRASPDLDRDFYRDVQIRVADLAPFLDRYRRLTADALSRAAPGEAGDDRRYRRTRLRGGPA